MNDERIYTTRQVMKLLGLKSRQTLYNWGAHERAVKVFPDQASALMWPASLVKELADEHDIEVDL